MLNGPSQVLRSRPACLPVASLAKHVNFVHLKLREHARPYCPGVAYQTKSDLTRHIEAVHEKRRAHACG